MLPLLPPPCPRPPSKNGLPLTPAAWEAAVPHLGAVVERSWSDCSLARAALWSRSAEGKAQVSTSAAWRGVTKSGEVCGREVRAGQRGGGGWHRGAMQDEEESKRERTSRDAGIQEEEAQHVLLGQWREGPQHGLAYVGAAIEATDFDG